MAGARYTCKCGKKFDKPRVYMDMGGGYQDLVSPCCRDHFSDAESIKAGEPCSKRCT